jgi:hypothetical protein
MARLKTLRFLFVFAAIVLIAKPFLGFSMVESGLRPLSSHTILIKVFLKRKPENIHEAAEERMAAISNLISSPGVKILSSIFCLLTFVCPLIRYPLSKVNHAIRQLAAMLIPDEQPYLLAGKLII